MSAAKESSGKDYESLAGLWKLLCALAVLVGHNLVTMKSMAPASGPLAFSFAAFQLFSPFHFFFFSGYLAARGLGDPTKPVWETMKTRALRIYVLIATALALGVLGRLAFLEWCPAATADSIWPISVWSGPIEAKQILLHLSPLGLVDTTRFNYATWYIYHELRLVAFFPLFAWIATRRSSTAKWASAILLLGVAIVLENKFWSHFPEFRTSPFQTMSFGVFFIGGILAFQGLQAGGWMRRLDRKVLGGFLVAGVAGMVLEPLGIRPPVHNPPILVVQTLVSQFLVFSALRGLLGNFPLPSLLKKACDWSVGIYIVHPPIHVIATAFAVQRASFLPLVLGMSISVAGGIAYHRWIERPSLQLNRWVRSEGRSK